MRPGVGVIEHLGGVDNHFAHQPLTGKQTEGVIDGRLGYHGAVSVHNRQHLLGGDVLGPGEQYLGDLDALLSRCDATGLEAVDHLELVLGLLFDIHGC